jgi:hypothetical protein
VIQQESTGATFDWESFVGVAVVGVAKIHGMAPSSTGRYVNVGFELAQHTRIP